MVVRTTNSALKLISTAMLVLNYFDFVHLCRKGNLIDNMVDMMEKYTDQLEEMVEERTKQLEEEKKKTDELLYQILPRWV